ncbi:hypothetical protein E2C01_084877 [Portunus trituberculatus]|uniref:Uncharacterized protein n=1 Tax=Portunus trituberculatus TaxID=210409 RepID=A0A5B7JC30_PORTR|nr:hypothetical protein [Portunus trituberculatus]
MGKHCDAWREWNRDLEEKNETAVATERLRTSMGGGGGAAAAGGGGGWGPRDTLRAQAVIQDLIIHSRFTRICLAVHNGHQTSSCSPDHELHQQRYVKSPQQRPRGSAMRCGAALEGHLLFVY